MNNGMEENQSLLSTRVQIPEKPTYGGQSRELRILFMRRKDVINMFDWKFQQDTIVHISNEHPLERKNKTQKQKWKNNSLL